MSVSIKSHVKMGILSFDEILYCTYYICKGMKHWQGEFALVCFILLFCQIKI
jgi:hypothetical protein